jgi:hypothetical protein
MVCGALILIEKGASAFWGPESPTARIDRANSKRRFMMFSQAKPELRRAAIRRRGDVRRWGRNSRPQCRSTRLWTKDGYKQKSKTRSDHTEVAEATEA